VGLGRDVVVVAARWPSCDRRHDVGVSKISADEQQRFPAGLCERVGKDLIAASYRSDRAAFGLRGKAKSSGNNVLVPSRGRAGLPSAIELRLVSPVFDPFFGAAN
jgi:hypothetical protein